LRRHQSIGKSTFDDLVNGKCTHIFIGPEETGEATMESLFKDPRFKERVCLLAIDQAHLIKDWRETFRTEYSALTYGTFMWDI
jgi:superfamily II DNA helicase RecQ